MKPNELQRQFEEMNEALCTLPQPSVYLQQLLQEGKLQKYPFSLLAALQETPQSPIHHPEGNVWNHTCLVVDKAAALRGRSKNTAAFMWAAVLHDIGKPATTKERKGRITSYDHDKAGFVLAQKFLSALTQDAVLIQQASQLVHYHMQPLFLAKKLPFANLEGMQRDTDPQELALLSYCDRTGRTNADTASEKAAAQQFWNACNFPPRL